MKLRENIETRYSDDPYYDLFQGGYLAPEKFLEDKEEQDTINNAIAIIETYLEDLEEEGLLEYI